MCPRTAARCSSSSRSLTGHSAVITSLTFTCALETFHPSWEHCVYTMWQCKHSLKGSSQQAGEVEQTDGGKIQQGDSILNILAFFFLTSCSVTSLSSMGDAPLVCCTITLGIECSVGADFEAFSTFNKIPFVHSW